MKKRWLSAICGAALLCGMLSGCSQKAEQLPQGEPPEAEEETGKETAEASGEKGEESIKIGFCNLSESYDFFLTVKESMEAACAEKGYELVYAAAEQDAAKMRTNWELFVNQGADIIVDANVVGDAGSTLATQYKESGNVPVVSVDNAYENAYFFGVDNEGAGIVAGEFMAEKVKEKWDGQVDCMLQFYLESNGPDVKLRNEGVYTGMVNSGIELSEDQVTWLNAVGAGQGLVDPGVMKSLVTDYLTAHPTEKHIVMACFNDDGGSSALAAVQAAGREDDVMIISHNADPQALDNLRLEGENSWVGTVCYSPDTYGEQIVALCEKILKGEEVGEKTFADVFVISDENISGY